jgi:hypothetical protein
MFLHAKPESIEREDVLGLGGTVELKQQTIDVVLDAQSCRCSVDLARHEAISARLGRTHMIVDVRCEEKLLIGETPHVCELSACSLVPIQACLLAALRSVSGNQPKETEDAIKSMSVPNHEVDFLECMLSCARDQRHSRVRRSLQNISRRETTATEPNLKLRGGVLPPFDHLRNELRRLAFVDILLLVQQMRPRVVCTREGRH